MKLTERKVDVVTGSPDLEDLHTVKSFPVFMGCVDHAASEDLVADMSWSISRDSGLIQLKKLLPLDILYQAQTTTAAIGAIWMTHHKAFANFINQSDPRSVLEIGGAHGILAKEYEIYSDISWTILEPNPAPIKDSKAKFIRGFFDDKFTAVSPFDTVIHSHVFEHIYEPDLFMSHLSKFMARYKKMIFSVPDLYSWLGKNFTNCINFEHTILLTEPYIDYLLEKHGFRVLRKEKFMEDHSIFYEAIRDESISVTNLPKNLYEINKNLYLNFVEYHDKLIKQINQKLTAGNKDVYLFGAHVFSQYLISYGLDTKRIKFILDNDVKKHGKRLYGTNLIVQPPAFIANEDAPEIILKAGIYNNEIKNQILSEINSSAVFYE